jgi:cytochrome c peroxidase
MKRRRPSNNHPGASSLRGWWGAISLLATVFAFGMGAPAPVHAVAPRPPPTRTPQRINPIAVRAAARDSGLDSLRTISIPAVPNLAAFVRDRAAAVRLGKALFWDMQVGSDGQACGSCHFHAGADNRSRNQLSPGLKNTNPALQNVFNPTQTSAGGPDFTLTAADFPFHVLAIPDLNNFKTRKVLFDTDDVASSMGAFAANFVGVTPGVSFDQGAAFADPIFNLLTPDASSMADNVRRVEPRNTPTMINAVFNHSNFWDGRAHNLFNGVSVIGPLDLNARVWMATPIGLTQVRVQIPNSSLASQAVGPPLSDLEMAFFNRSFPLVGRKVLSLTPLGLQRVDPTDSVLGALSRAPQNGLSVSYPALISQAFRSEFWNSTARTPQGFTLMEANFALFFGLAVQLYETTLVSDRSPFDRFMEGDDLALTQTQLQGLLVFMNRGTDPDGLSRNPARLDAIIAALAEPRLGPQRIVIGVGNCVSCHGGPEFTDAAFTSLTEVPGALALIEQEDTAVLMPTGLLAISPAQGLLDNGFSNIGVRPTHEDLGRGSKEGGYPLSFTRQVLDPNLTYLLPPGIELPCTAGVECPTNLMVDGAFKIPGLRNVELTGPYFHNGGQATLSEVIEFYDRQGDFGDVNIANLDQNMVFVDIEEDDEVPLVSFLVSLTDPRVRNEQAPFDRPQIIIPNGGTFGAEETIDVPAVGRGGRPAKNLPPLDTFLGLDP